MNKSALGLAVALIAGFCIGTSLLVTQFERLAPLRHVFLVIWSVVALVLFTLAFFQDKSARAHRPTEVPSGADADDEPLEDDSLFRRPRYWGTIAALFAVISHFIHPWVKIPAQARPPPPPPAKAQPPPAPPPTDTNPPVPPKPKPDPFAEHRSLRLQGVSLQGERSSAILDGRTYIQGEQVMGATIIRINNTGVLLLKDDETYEIRFNR